MNSEIGTLSREAAGGAVAARIGVERFQITDRNQWLALRKHDVTASVAGALLGVHDYTTAYGLWALKAGKIEEDPEETAPMKRGRLLEPVAIQLLCEQCPDWKIERGTEYLRDPAVRLGATPDVFTFDPKRGLGVVQIKSVEAGVFRKKWRNPETGELTPPLWIVVQAIVEAHLAGAKWAAVAALVIGFGVELHVLEIPIHAGVLDRIKAETGLFWSLVENGTPPPMDYARDGEIIARLFEGVEGEIVDLHDDNEFPELIAERETIAARKKADGERWDTIRAAIISKMSAKKATAGRLADGRIVTAKNVDRDGYTVKPTSFIDVRVSKPKKQGKAA